MVKIIKTAQYQSNKSVVIKLKDLAIIILVRLPSLHEFSDFSLPTSNDTLVWV